MADTPVHAAPAPAAPEGELSIRTMAMPADTNQNGDIFGGWLLSQMDIAGGIFASKVSQSRAVTVAIEAMTFRKPVNVGDVVSVFAPRPGSAAPLSLSISKRGCSAGMNRN
jgi:acyl-CoA thioesterase YciA